MHGEDRVGFERDCSILAVCLVQYQYFEAGRPLHITGEPLRNIPFDTTTNHMRNSKHPIRIECLVFVGPLVSKEEPRDISHDEEWSELEMSLFLLVDVITWKHGRSSAHYARCAVAPRSL